MGLCVIDFTLTAQELELCKRLGADRAAKHRAKGTPDFMQGRTFTAVEYDQAGVKGEWVFCREYVGRGVWPDANGIGDGGVFDYVTRGEHFEVKTRLRAAGSRNDFVQPRRKASYPVKFVLFETTSVDDPIVRLVGWLAPADYAEHRREVDLGNGPVWMVDRKHVRAPETLFDAAPAAPAPVAPGARLFTDFPRRTCVYPVGTHTLCARPIPDGATQRLCEEHA